jgi:hypothetical protein
MPNPTTSDDPGDLALAWRAMTGALPDDHDDDAADAAEEARKVAADRVRRGEHPDDGRQEGGISRGIDTAGRLVSAAGLDAAQRFVLDPLMTGARLTKDAWEGRPIPDPKLDPEGYARYVGDVNTAASLGLVGRLPSRAAPRAAPQPVATAAERATRGVEELGAQPGKSAAKTVEDLHALAHDQAAQETYWEDLAANTKPEDAHAALEQLEQERMEMWDAVPDHIKAELEAAWKRLDDENK